MQLRPIQSTNKKNNNLVNFQGIHGSKKILSRLPELRLDRFGIDECGDRFEVLITTGKTTFWGQFKEFFVQVGEGITTNSKGKLELVGAKSERLAFETDGRLQEGHYDSLNLFGQLIRNITKDISSEKLKKYLMEGKLRFSDFPSYAASNLRNSLNDKDLEEVANFYTEKMLKTVDNEGNTPLHKDSENIRFATEFLQGFPELLADLLLTKNRAGEIPTDLGIYSHLSLDSVRILKDIVKQLRTNPRALATLMDYKAPDALNSPSLAERVQNGANSGYGEEILKTVKEAKDVVNSSYGKFTPVLSRTEYRVAKEVEELTKDGIDINKILKISRMSDVKNTNGNLLNSTNFITKILDFIVNEANLDDKQMTINILKNLPELSFDKVDDMGISVLEKIMNTEDFSLLELVKGKKLSYHPELDDAYNQIDNDEFKKQLSEFNLNFIDLKRAIKAASMDAVKKLEFEFESPFYHRKTTGREIYDTSREDDTYEMWFYRDFCDKYKKYLYTQYDERDEKAAQKSRGWWE